MHQHDRLPLAFVEISDLDRAIAEYRHCYTGRTVIAEYRAARRRLRCCK